MGRLANRMSLEDFHNRVLPVKNKLYRFAYRMMGNEEDAEDIVQEVFIKVWKKRDEMHTLLNMEAWCMRLVKNKCLDTLKSSHFKVSKQNEEIDIPEESNTPFANMAMHDTMQKIKSFINSLPEKQKQVIQLRDIEGYSYQEISGIMEVDLNQVKVNLHRARNTIREKLINAEAYGI